MKIATMIIFILMVAGIMVMFAMMTSDINSNYPDVPINNTGVTSSYDYSNQLNTTFSPLYNNLNTLNNPDASFFSKLGAGFGAIPYFLLIIPITVFGSFGYLVNIISGFFNILNVPIVITLLFILGILIYIILRLADNWQSRTPLT
jgi:hypothetical protein